MYTGRLEIKSNSLHSFSWPEHKWSFGQAKEMRRISFGEREAVVKIQGRSAVVVFILVPVGSRPQVSKNGNS
jgi:hypothetical protein